MWDNEKYVFLRVDFFWLITQYSLMINILSQFEPNH